MNQLIPCLKHDGSYLLYINYSKEKAKYQCEVCEDIEQGKQEVQINSKRIHIRSALNSPEYLVTNLNLSPILKSFFQDLDKLNEQTMGNYVIEIHKEIEKLQNTLQAVKQEFIQQKNLLLEKKQQIRDQLREVMKFNQFKQLITEIQLLGDSINSQSIEQNENMLYNYFQDLTKNDSKDLNKAVDNILNQIIQFQQNHCEQYPQFKKLEDQFKSLNSKQIEFENTIDKINVGTRIGSCLLQRLYSMNIDNLISQRLNKRIIKSYQQVYLSSKDGLNGKTFENKVNGKSNLLMIFKSKSGNIFGGYSPCLWSPTIIGEYVQDDSQSSFLFSQTHNEIYPLKGGENSICCKRRCGPVFGGNRIQFRHDIYIDEDFNGGYSQLGESYYWNGYSFVKSTHLFGQQTPKIEVCEIYQAIFI